MTAPEVQTLQEAGWVRIGHIWHNPFLRFEDEHPDKPAKPTHDLAEAC